MDETTVELQNVTKFFKIPQKKGIFGIFGKKSKLQNSFFKVLDDVSFSVKKGEVLGIIGKNGSGKSTLLRLIANIYSPDRGIIKVKGRLSPMMQIGTGFQKDFAAKENIIINGMLLGLSRQEIESKVDSVIEYAELEKFRELPLKHYSSGMKSRLAFATAMKIDPDIFLIDEILSVGDKDFKQKSYETFLSLKKRNKTIIHATHSLSSISEFSDRVLLLDKGKIIMIGEPKEVVKKYQAMKPTRNLK